MDKPRVCVIGAGISGLTSGKALSDYGIAYDCFESGDRVGGNWAFRNSNGHSSAYQSLHIDTSKEGLRFRDFAISDSYPDFPHHTQVHEYIEQYCDAFDLRRRIRFETSVDHCERLPGGGWRVRTSDGVERFYDVLVVGNGHHWDPRYPSFPGEFDGPAIHSHHYIAPDEPLDLRGSRVLVVGIGNSASDIVSELAHKTNASKVFLSTRSGAWVVPKYMLGRPLDQAFHMLPWLPLKPQRTVARLLPLLLSGRMERYGLPTPNHRFLETHPTQSSELLLRLGSGDAVAKPNIERLEHDRVRFVDGSVEEIDAIIWATGYNITFPFFDPDFISAQDNRIRLFKRMFLPGIDDVVFIGFGQSLPTLFPFIELQSHVMARYVAGRYRPPGIDEMEAMITADEKRFTGHCTERPRNTQQLDFPVYDWDLRKKEIPAGRARVDKHGPVRLAGRAPATNPATT